MIRPESLLRLRGTMRTIQPRMSRRVRSPFLSSPQRRGLRVSVQHRADEKPQPFKHQLYESTQQRLKRERAEQERYSQYQTQSQGGRYAALMFGTPITQSLLQSLSVSRTQFLMPLFFSIGFLFHRSVLPRFIEACRASFLFDDVFI